MKAQAYKIVDKMGQNRYGVVVASLQELMKKAEEKLGLPASEMKVMLECDGTEVDEQDYFATLEANTCFTILKMDENWIPPSRYDYKGSEYSGSAGDVVDGSKVDLLKLLGKIRADMGYVSLLGCQELEVLADMDPQDPNLHHLDEIFLNEVKEASNRYLNDRRDAKEALELLKLYHAATSSMIGKGYANANVAAHLSPQSSFSTKNKTVQ